MQVPDLIRKCVGFVGVKNSAGDPQLGGTFFLSGLRLAEGEGGVVYAVTAAHVVEQVRSNSQDGLLWLRMNVPDAGIRWVGTHLDQWVFHPNPGVDVAALHFPLPHELVEYMWFPIDDAATAAVIDRHQIGVGDEVFLTGLFIKHYGYQRNIPIVRVGNIAAMPSEPIRWDRNGAWQLMPTAYLVEARSIGGLSGSPVFVYVDSPRQIGAQTVLGAPSIYLLGMMHGHWDTDRGQGQNPDVALEAGVGELGPGADTMREELVNMGIGIVVPSDAILETLNGRELKDPRDQFLTSRGQRLRLEPGGP